MQDEDFMRMAIQKALEGIAKGQTPFGACIVKGHDFIVCAHNAVWANTDITAHAEIVAIREACKALNTVDLSGCTIYTTCEPCPMCYTACHWARIDRIVYGARIEDAARAGFHELTISNEQLRELGGDTMRITEGILRMECATLFEVWASQPEAKTY